MTKAWRVDKPMPLLATVTSILLGNMLRLDQVALLGLKGIKGLKDNV